MLESLGILSGFNIAETIREKYEQFAITKLRDITIQLRGSFFYHKDLTPTQAADELVAISPLMPVFSKIRAMIYVMEDSDFHDFKTVSMDFFDTVDMLYANLQDIAAVHAAYEISKPVLAVDWDRSEDDHWDNY
ncbi:hypothetical protein [Rhodoflexus sp.]